VTASNAIATKPNTTTEKGVSNRVQSSKIKDPNRGNPYANAATLHNEPIKIFGAF
jgi:hypothetical protein